MSFENVKKVWMNGKLVDFADAKIHIFTHALHYGSGVFEGERCYNTARGPAIFRLDDHLDRLFWSAKIYRMAIPYTVDQLKEATLAVVRANDFKACYIRPLVYRGYGTLGVNPFPNPVDVAIGCYEWGKYLGADALEQGVDTCCSSWMRIAPNTMPAMAKATANYANSQLIKMEAITNGYHEGHRARSQRAHLRGLGREPLPGLEGSPLHAAAFGLDAARHHAPLRDPARP